MPDHSETGDLGEIGILTGAFQQIAGVLASSLSNLDTRNRTQVVVSVVQELSKSLDREGHAALQQALAKMQAQGQEGPL
ncbi:hypothetical protein [Microbacterium deminutum]|uniref:hypothetical protein n=1 Tax=Microbacterium deminutum TaxID=344164 RepID=UPI0031D658CF